MNYPTTYKGSQGYLFSEFKKLGWTVKDTLKVPQVIPPNREYTLFFKTQAVYCNNHSMHLDYRGMSIDTFLYHVNRWVSP
jgi:hypothetical protein